MGAFTGMKEFTKELGKDVAKTAFPGALGQAITAPTVANTKDNFQKWMGEQGQSVISTMFPQLSKFMDFKTDTKSASDKVSDIEKTLTPNARKNAGDNVAPEQILDSLGAIDERLKVQGIVLASTLTEQTKTNQLLSRIAGLGGSGSGGSGGSIAATAADAAGNLLGDGIGTFIKSWGTKILGGLMAPEVAIPVAVAGYGLEKMRENQATSTDYFKKHSENGGVDVDSDGNPIITPDQTGAVARDSARSNVANEITSLRADIAKQKQLADQNPTDAAILATLQKLQEKLDKDIQSQATLSQPLHPSSTGRMPNAVDLVPVAAPTAPTSKSLPLYEGAYVPDALPKGTSPLDIVRHGGGTIAGGSGGDAVHPASTGGYRTNPTVAHGNLAKNQQIAFDTLKGEGMTDEAARIFVANLSGESLKDPTNSHWDRTHNSQGIAQWDDVRSEAIKQHFGSYPKDMSVADQTKAAKWEMSTNPRFKTAWADLNNEKMQTQDRMHSVVKHFEAPLDTEGSTQTRMKFYEGFKPGQGGGAATAPQSRKEVLDHLDDMQKRGWITSDQCVDLAMSTVGLKYGDKAAGGHTGEWRAMGDITGDTAAGTPVATMLDRQGKPSNLYDEGKGGRMVRDIASQDPELYKRLGGGKDHAGVLTGNKRYGKDGLEVEMADQWKGHMWDANNQHTRWLTHGAKKAEDNLDYYKLIGAGGDLLGGKNNAEWQRLHQSAPLANRAPIRDTQKTTAAQLVHNSNTEAVAAAAQARQTASVNVQQINSSQAGSMTAGEKSERMSKGMGGMSANPPPQRLSELFNDNVYPKSF